jgi:hypothetical protein
MLVRCARAWKVARIAVEARRAAVRRPDAPARGKKYLRQSVDSGKNRH